MFKEELQRIYSSARCARTNGAGSGSELCWRSEHTGQFLQTDPIGYEDDLNLYSYAANSPTNLRDPSGMARVCTSVAGSNIPACVHVDADGDGDVSDTDLTRTQQSALAFAFGTFIRANRNADLSQSGATVLGPRDAAEDVNFARAVSQFVGFNLGGLDDMTIELSDTRSMSRFFAPAPITTGTRGYYRWNGQYHEIWLNRDARSIFTHGGNMARTILHEFGHRPDVFGFGGRRVHAGIDGWARLVLWSYGLADGGCERVSSLAPACGPNGQ